VDRTPFTAATASGLLRGWVAGEGPSVLAMPGAWSHVVPGAGHFVWHEAPGCLLGGMARLLGHV